MKKFIRKPRFNGSHWIIEIVDSKSPFANILEEIKFGCQTAAFHGYAKIKKEINS